MTDQKFDHMLYVRCTGDQRKGFKDKAGTYGDVSDVHRELIDAFLEGRVTIVPGNNVKLEKFYNDHRSNS